MSSSVLAGRIQRSWRCHRARLERRRRAEAVAAELEQDDADLEAAGSLELMSAQLRNIDHNGGGIAFIASHVRQVLHVITLQAAIRAFSSSRLVHTQSNRVIDACELAEAESTCRAELYADEEDARHNIASEGFARVVVDAAIRDASADSDDALSQQFNAFLEGTLAEAISRGDFRTDDGGPESASPVVAAAASVVDAILRETKYRETLWHDEAAARGDLDKELLLNWQRIIRRVPYRNGVAADLVTSALPDPVQVNNVVDSSQSAVAKQERVQRHDIEALESAGRWKLDNQRCAALIVDGITRMADAADGSGTLETERTSQRSAEGTASGALAQGHSASTVIARSWRGYASRKTVAARGNAIAKLNAQREDDEVIDSVVDEATSDALWRAAQLRIEEQETVERRSREIEQDDAHSRTTSEQARSARATAALGSSAVVIARFWRCVLARRSLRRRRELLPLAQAAREHEEGAADIEADFVAAIHHHARMFSLQRTHLEAAAGLHSAESSARRELIQQLNVVSREEEARTAQAEEVIRGIVDAAVFLVQHGDALEESESHQRGEIHAAEESSRDALQTQFAESKHVVLEGSAAVSLQRFAHQLIARRERARRAALIQQILLEDEMMDVRLRVEREVAAFYDQFSVSEAVEGEEAVSRCVLQDSEVRDREHLQTLKFEGVEASKRFHLQIHVEAQLQHIREREWLRYASVVHLQSACRARSSVRSLLDLADQQRTVPASHPVYLDEALGRQEILTDEAAVRRAVLRSPWLCFADVAPAQRTTHSQVDNDADRLTSLHGAHARMGLLCSNFAHDSVPTSTTRLFEYLDVGYRRLVARSDAVGLHAAFADVPSAVLAFPDFAEVLGAHRPCDEVVARRLAQTTRHLPVAAQAAFEKLSISAEESIEALQTSLTVQRLGHLCEQLSSTADLGAATRVLLRLWIEIVAPASDANRDPAQLFSAICSSPNLLRAFVVRTLQSKWYHINGSTIAVIREMRQEAGKFSELDIANQQLLQDAKRWTAGLEQLSTLHCPEYAAVTSIRTIPSSSPSRWTDALSEMPSRPSTAPCAMSPASDPGATGRSCTVTPLKPQRPESHPSHVPRRLW